MWTALNVREVCKYWSKDFEAICWINSKFYSGLVQYMLQWDFVHAHRVLLGRGKGAIAAWLTQKLSLVVLNISKSQQHKPSSSCIQMMVCNSICPSYPFFFFFFFSCSVFVKSTWRCRWDRSMFSFYWLKNKLKQNNQKWLINSNTSITVVIMTCLFQTVAPKTGSGISIWLWVRFGPLSM